MSRSLLKFSGGSVHDYATIADQPKHARRDQVVVDALQRRAR